MASIPGDFRSIYEALSWENIPDFDMRQLNETKENSEDDVNGGSGGGTPQVVPIQRRLRFWQRNKQADTVIHFN